jgi:hypothetical protein
MQRYATTAVTAAAPPIAATASSIRTTPTASMPTVCTLSALNGSFAASSSRSRALRPDRAVPTGGAGSESLSMSSLPLATSQLAYPGMSSMCTLSG